VGGLEQKRRSGEIKCSVTAGSVVAEMIAAPPRINARREPDHKKECGHGGGGPFAALDSNLLSWTDIGRWWDVGVPPVVAGHGAVAHRACLINREDDVGHARHRPRRPNPMTPTVPYFNQWRGVGALAEASGLTDHSVAAYLR
jgi:hypothetical protein